MDMSFLTNVGSACFARPRPTKQEELWLGPQFTPRGLPGSQHARGVLDQRLLTPRLVTPRRLPRNQHSCGMLGQKPSSFPDSTKMEPREAHGAEGPEDMRPAGGSASSTADGAASNLVTLWQEPGGVRIAMEEGAQWLAAQFCILGVQLGMESGRLQGYLDASGWLDQVLSASPGLAKMELREAAQATSVDSEARAEELPEEVQQAAALKVEAPAADDSASDTADQAAPLLVARAREPDDVCVAMAEDLQGHLQGGSAGADLPAAAAGRGDGSASLEEVTQACTDQLQVRQHPCIASALDRILEAYLWEDPRAREVSIHSCVLQFQHAAEIQNMELEMETMGRGLEEKEQDILNIQFEMAQLQNRLKDQAQQACRKMEAVQRGSQELAGADSEMESKAPPSQRDDLLDQFQREVAELSQELERSRAAYQNLEREHWAVVSKHESEQQSVVDELERLQAVASSAALNARANVESLQARKRRVSDPDMEALGRLQGA